MDKEKVTSDKKTNSEAKKNKIASVFVVLALVFGVVMAIGIFTVLARINKMPETDTEYLADSPHKPLVIMTMVSCALMGICLAISTIITAKQNRAAAKAGRKVIYSVDASVLRDPRIKQLPEVQRLLQYESVQKAFFDGEFPAEDDPHLLELVDVLAKLADENGVIRL